jgi:methylated-DNA-[protein]-cysteine S-methyltransferase
MPKPLPEANRLDYAAIWRGPFAALGLLTSDDRLIGVHFLPTETAARVPPRNSIAELACVELNAYLDRPTHAFQVPIHLKGSLHDLRVWQALQTIPAGSPRTYGAIATLIQSSAQAVGNACARNPIPLIVPCHRVVARGEKLAGFMGQKTDFALGIKRWLLAHEAPHVWS